MTLAPTLLRPSVASGQGALSFDLEKVSHERARAPQQPAHWGRPLQQSYLSPRSPVKPQPSPWAASQQQSLPQGQAHTQSHQQMQQQQQQQQLTQQQPAQQQLQPAQQQLQPAQQQLQPPKPTQQLKPTQSQSVQDAAEVVEPQQPRRPLRPRGFTAEAWAQVQGPSLCARRRLQSNGCDDSGGDGRRNQLHGRPGASRHTLDCIGNASQQKGLDPVLAQRWAALREREASGQDELAAKHIETALSSRASTGATPWEVRKNESELGRRLAERKGKVQQQLQQQEQLQQQKDKKEADLEKATAEIAPTIEAATATLSTPKAARTRVSLPSSPSCSTHAGSSTVYYDISEDGSPMADTPTSVVCGGRMPSRQHSRPRVTAPQAPICIRLQVRPGETISHEIPWPTASASDDDEQDASFSLRYTAVVLQDRHLDMEVSARLCPDFPGREAEEVLLRRSSRAGTLAGFFTPRCDGRVQASTPRSGAGALATPVSVKSGGDADAAIFSFSNTTSWFSTLTVDLFVVFDAF